MHLVSTVHHEAKTVLGLFCLQADFQILFEVVMRQARYATRQLVGV